jgi:hypothetical protein
VQSCDAYLHRKVSIEKGYTGIIDLQYGQPILADCLVSKGYKPKEYYSNSDGAICKNGMEYKESFKNEQGQPYPLVLPWCWEKKSLF